MSRNSAHMKHVEWPTRNEMNPANLEASLEPKSHGGGTLRVRYHGPIAAGKKLWVRMGERRDGRDWLEPRDVEMSTADGEATVSIACKSGRPIEGACFAFYTRTGDGETDWQWDNGGHPFGYYRFDARTGAIEVC